MSGGSEKKERDDRKKPARPGVRILAAAPAPVADALKSGLHPHFPVTTARSAAQLASRLRSAPPPKLLLVSAALPGADLPEICSRSSLFFRSGEIPVVAVVDDEESEIRALEAGADDAVRLPVSGPLLRARVAAVLEKHRMADELAEQAAALGRRFIRASEAERKRIACELHDDLAQDLSAAKIVCDTLPDLTPLSDVAGKRVRVVSGVLQTAIDTVRNMSYRLSPAGLDHTGLVPALKWYCDDFTRDTRLPVHIEAERDADRRVGLNARVHLFRVAQEALANAARHSGASEVTIRAGVKDGIFYMRVRDNGRGFPPDHGVRKPGERRRLGLSSMTERGRLMGGKVVVTSDAGMGVRVEATLPLPKD